MEKRVFVESPVRRQMKGDFSAPRQSLRGGNGEGVLGNGSRL